MILSKGRIAEYIAKEATNKEYLKPKGDQRPWVLGTLFYRDRIAEILEWCFQKWPGNCLEIGCYGGTTTRRMLGVAEAHDRLVLGVDPYIGRSEFWNEHLGTVYPAFMRLTEPWRNSGRLVFLKDRSQSKAARQFVEAHAPYAFVFIDGDHRYDAALSDLRLTLPLTNGVVCLDDWFTREVRRATAQALEGFPSWDIALEVDEFAETYLIRRDQDA